MVCLLAVGCSAIAPVANAESGRQPFLKPGKSAGNIMIEIKRRGRDLPIGPGYVYHDYFYYYSRGYYPT
jgi:hypothetical protein